jgi:hypothetical protein
MNSHVGSSSESPVSNKLTFWQRTDACLAIVADSVFATAANRFLLICLFLFAVSLPHSIASAHFALSCACVAWVVRDGALRKWHFIRTPLDLPLLWFSGLTLLSAIFSVEPNISLPKLKSLLLFGALYLLVTNLSARAIKPLLAVVLLSALAGVLFSFGDKLYGRGVTIQAIAADSPLLHDQPLETYLQPGDTIWMIARRRVYSLSDTRRILRRQPVGKPVDIEAIHNGDPIPTVVTATPALQASENPLGLTVSGRTQRFRVSGFGRQFQTYAEQMQLLALFCYGLLLVKLPTRRYGLGLSALFLCFAGGLILTSTRAVLATFLVTLLVLPWLSRRRQASALGLTLVLLLGGMGYGLMQNVRSIEGMQDSLMRRVEYMRAGLRMIPQHPLLGVGMDSATAHWRDWNFPGKFITHTHSTLIQVAMERGLPALAVLLWLWMAAWLSAWRMHCQANPYALATLAALLGFGLSALVNYNFGDAEVLLLLLAFWALMQVSHHPGTTPDKLISETPN